jgi:hypothetical protein
MNLIHVIPMYNWSLTERFFKEIGYLEGRDYTLERGQTAMRITFKYTFQFDRYWSHWGRHIVNTEFN